MITNLSRISGLLLILAAVQAFAYETGGELALEAEFADNFNQSPDNPVSDVAVTASGRFNISHTGPMFELSGVGRVRHTEYIDETFERQWFLNSDIGAAWILNDSFIWHALNQTNQVRIDPLDINVPSNIENQNLFRTGPEWVINFGATTSITLGAAYGINSFSDSDADNERVAGIAQLRRYLNSHLALSLNVQTQEVSFDNTEANQDYGRDDAFVRFEWSRAALALRGDFGVTRVSLKGADERDDPMKSLLATYRQNSGGVVSLLLRDAVGDSTSDFDDGLFSGEGNSQSTVFSVSDLFRDRRAELLWSRALGRFTGTAGAYYRDRDFFTTDFDQIQYGVGGNLSFSLNPRWVVSIGAGSDKTEFKSDGREDDFWSVALRIARNFGPRLIFFAQVAHLERDSTDPAFGFDDERVLIGITYRVGAQPMARSSLDRRTDRLAW